MSGNKKKKTSDEIWLCWFLILTWCVVLADTLWYHEMYKENLREFMHKAGAFKETLDQRNKDVEYLKNEVYYIKDNARIDIQELDKHKNIIHYGRR